MTTDISLESIPSTQPERSFYTEHKENVRELFSALGRQSLWSDNLPDLIPYTQARWRGDEHGLSQEKDTFEQHQEKAAWPILHAMGVTAETIPGVGTHVDQINVAGARMRANCTNLAFVKRLLDEGVVTTSGPIVFWTGQRLRFEAEALTADEFFDHSGRYPGCDDSQNAWVRYQRTLPWDTGDKWKRAIATETETVRLAVTRVFGAVALASEVHLVHGVIDKHASAPPRLVADYRYRLQGYPELIVLNGRAVERDQGLPRPTTISCALEALDRHAPTQDSKVLFVSSNPHTRRMTEDVRDVFQANGRSDIELVPAGPAARADASIQLVLGEVARLLYISQPA